MELTVRRLREILYDLDDDIILAHLGEGNGDFHVFTSVKRLLLLEHVFENKTYLTINDQGSHFTGKQDQSGLVIKESSTSKLTPLLEEK